MPSAALKKWRTDRAKKLDEIATAHARVGGAARGRRFATEQINHAYAVLLSSQFQGFCRDLHSESADTVLQNGAFAVLRGLLLPALTEGRKLDTGNPNSGNIGNDFKKFGLAFWDEVKNADPRATAWQAKLDRLNLWRNAIAHQDFKSPSLGLTALHLSEVRAWRGACNHLAAVFDRVMNEQLHALTGTRPW